ncbi:centrosomal protein of 68 kDa isoform X2 [Carcharodon carcharias]|uniref:centrosomal protein of 68 kDa isoform X2 n=1 Tax=Carcharodon carcharias TaxID=13397 RepID=UPI001B7D916C|nr:centrosomal protein of 68 kDa isoform X2 [Carcharodon carcharias]
MCSQFRSFNLTPESKQGADMQELNKRYSHSHSECSSRGMPLENGSDSGTCCLPCETLQSSFPGNQPKSSPSVSRVYEPAAGFNLKMTRFNVSAPRSLKESEAKRPDDQRCLFAPRYSTCLDTSTFSQCLPKRKATLSSQDVNLNKDVSLDQNSNGCLASTVSNLNPLHEKQIQPYLSEYWARRHPDTFQLFRDRTSPDWDPDEEYQALLDFTYPLRPGHLTSKDYLDDDNLSSDSYLKDSGIMDDSPLPSLSNTLITNNTLSLPAYQSSTSTTANPAWDYRSCREDDMNFPLHSSSPLHMYSQPSNWTSHPNYKASIIPRVFVGGPAVNKMQLSEGFTNCAIPPDCTFATSVVDSSFLSKSSNEESSNWLFLGKDPAGFILTTQILPLNKAWEIDEEFLTLPCKLNELEVLAQQLENLSVHSDNKTAFVTNAKGGIVKTREDTDVPGVSTEDSLIDQSNSTEAAHLSCQSGSTPKNTPKGPQCDDIIMDLKKANDFINKLGRWPGSRLISNDPLEQVSEEQKNDSLLADIQSFSSKLEEMVQWLYEVAETTDNWIPPQPRMDSIKASLDNCMAFRNDIKEHRELTETVLKSGEHLLESMINTTPVLKDTLELIARQSKKLNGHAAHLYLSVLSAMNMVKDDLETKQQEFEAAGLERHSVQTPEMATCFEERDASNHMNLDHPI